MRRIHILAAGLLAATTGSAHAITVYPGCAVPSLKATHHTFYIDPVNGSQKGDGSAAKPWHTLAEVLDVSNKLLSTMAHNAKTWSKGDTSLVAVNPNAPIKPGDVLMLKTGNHGDVHVLNSYNTDFITITAAPGQTPILGSLSVISSGKWLFQNVKVVGQHFVKGAVTATISFGKSDWIGTTSDVIIDSSQISATDSTAGWTDNDWQTRTDSYELALVSHCLSATNNHLSNGMNGVALGSDNSVVQDNLITTMFNDGIDFYGSNQVIRRNTVRDGVNSVSGSVLHPDGIQGWSTITKGVATLNKNDVIDSNTIIKTGDGAATQSQGISIFDGEWNGLQIMNNVVVSNVYHGIAMYGGTNVSIVNNTVLASDPAYGTWILVNPSKTSTPGKNVVVRNNIASNIVINYSGVTYDHNLAGTSIQYRDASNKMNVVKSGVVGNSNRVSPTVVSDFVTADPSTATYNLKLRPNSVAIAAGSDVNAPQYDIVSRKRTNPFDVGAYQH